MSDHPTAAEVIDRVRLESDYRPHVPLGNEILDALHRAAGGRWIVIDAETGDLWRLEQWGNPDTGLIDTEFLRPEDD